MGIDTDRPILPERAEPFMRSNEYRNAIDKFGMSQVRASRFFGVSDRTGQRWARGEAEVPPSIGHLINLMLRYDLMPENLDRSFK